MSIQTADTPEKLHQVISEFLLSDYSQEDLVKIYGETRKCAVSFRGIYSALPVLPSRKNEPLDGLQDIMDWSKEASAAVDDIASNLDQQTITKVINQLNKLRGFANKVLSLVDKKLQNETIAEYTRKTAQEKARIQAEIDRRFLAKQKTGNVVSPLVLKAQIKADFWGEIGFTSSKESEENKAVQSYLSRDPTFNDKLSQLNNEISKVFEEINKLAGNNTSDGKLIDIYCKLKDIPLQQQRDEIEHVYSFQNLADVILDNCIRLYSSIDNVIKTFEEIQTKPQNATSKKKNRVLNFFYKLYELTIKAAFSAIIDAMKS